MRCWSRFALVVFCLVICLPSPGSALFRKSGSGKPGVIAELKTAIEQDFQVNNFQGVVDKYRSFVDQNPGGHVPLVVKSLYSEALANTGQVNEAIVALREMIGEWPVHLDLVRMQYNLANLLFMEGRQEEARAAYEKMVLMTREHDDYIAKARDRLSKMKDKAGGRKDKAALELFDIEAILQAGDIPVGAEEYLQGLVAKGDSPKGKGDENTEKARDLLDKIHDLKDNKARALLNEARRLFDQERKYAEVRGLLETLLREYPDTSERRSVETLMQEVDRRLPKKP